MNHKAGSKKNKHANLFGASMWPLGSTGMDGYSIASGLRK